MRQLSLELSCTVVGRIFTCQDISPFLGFLCVFMCMSQGFPASKFHVRFNRICTTSEMLTRDSMRNSTIFSTLVSNSPCVALLLAFLNKTIRDARLTALFVLKILTDLPQNRFLLEFLTHHAKCHLRLMEMTHFPAWMTWNVLATTTECFRFFVSLPACSVCLNAHSFPSLQRRFFFFLMISEHSGGCQSSRVPFGRSPFLKAKHVGLFACPGALVPFGVLLPEEFRLGELDGREPSPSEH